MKISVLRQWIYCIFCCLILMPSTVYSGAVIHSARAAGMGAAFIATADDPSAVFFNPAGLPNIEGSQYYGGFSTFYMKTEFTSPDGTSETTRDEVYLPPHAYLTTDFGFENFGFGVGVYSSFGVGGRRWSEAGQLRYLSTENTIATMDISTAAGWAVIPNRLFIGGSLFYMLSKNTMERMVDQSALGADDGKMAYDGWGGGWGFSLALLAEPIDDVRFGLYYRSRVDITHEGDLHLENIAPALHPLFGGEAYKSHAENDQVMPSVIGLGVACEPIDALTVGIDFQWFEWSTFGQSALKIKDPVPEAGLADMTVDMNWDDSWILNIGGEYRLNDRWAIRGGYFFMKNQVPDETVTPASPEADYHNITIGAGHKTGNITLDAAYSYQFPSDRDADNDILSGEFTTTNHTLTLSLGYAF